MKVNRRTDGLTHDRYKASGAKNIVGQGENAGDQLFLLFQNCFLPFPK